MAYNSGWLWKSKFALVFLIGILARTSVQGQVPVMPLSVVSDYGMEDDLWLLGTSVKSIGMGRVGVTMREPRAHSENPALLITGECFSQTTLIPSGARLSGSNYAKMSAVNHTLRISDVIFPARSEFRLVLSYEHVNDERYGVPYLIWRQNGRKLNGIEDQGAFHDSLSVRSLAAAFGYCGEIEGGFGFAYNWYEKGSADFGIYLRCPFWRRPLLASPSGQLMFDAAVAAGLSYLNSRPYDSEADLPLVRKLGLTVDMGVEHGPREWLRLTAGYQRDDILLRKNEINVVRSASDPFFFPSDISLKADGTGTNRIGIELCMLELLSLRAGMVDGIALGALEGYDYWTYRQSIRPARGVTDNQYKTYGFTLSTEGLRILLSDQASRVADASASLPRSLLRTLNLEFSWAHIDEREAVLYQGGDSYSITLLF